MNLLGAAGSGYRGSLPSPLTTSNTAAIAGSTRLRIGVLRLLGRHGSCGSHRATRGLWLLADGDGVLMA